MGIGCVLVIWTAVAIAAALAAVAFGFVGVRTQHWKRWVALTFGLGSAVLALAAALFVASWIWSSLRGPAYSESPDAFRAAFQIEPPAGVHGIRSQTSGSTDSSTQLLRFIAPPEIAQRLAARFRPVPPADCSALRTIRKPPEWWHPRDQSECFISDRFDSTFASSRAWFSYDRATNEAFFLYEGID